MFYNHCISSDREQAYLTSIFSRHISHIVPASLMLSERCSCSSSSYPHDGLQTLQRLVYVYMNKPLMISFNYTIQTLKCAITPLAQNGTTLFLHRTINGLHGMLNSL